MKQSATSVFRFPWFTILAIILSWLTINIVTYDLYPGLWIDEVFYMDPAINLSSGDGFKSTACYFHGKDTFWAGNVPGYPLLMSLWLLMLEPSLLTTRLLGYCLVMASAILFLDFIRRRKLAASRLDAILITLIFVFTPSIAFTYRSGRMESMALFLFCLILWSMHGGLSARARNTILFSCAAMMSWTHLSCSLFLGIIFSAYLLLDKNRGGVSLQAWLSVAAGGLFGFAALITLHFFMNSLDSLFEAFLFVTPAREQEAGYYGIPGYAPTMEAKLKRLASAYFEPTSMALLAILALAACKSESRELRNKLLILISGFGTIIAVMFLLNKFPIYYRWMPFLATLVMAFFLTSGKFSKHLHTATLSILLLACLSGLPYIVFSGILNRESLSDRKLNDFLEPLIHSSDSVMAGPGIYLAAKPKARMTYLPQYLKYITNEEKKQISLVAGGTNDIKEAFRHLPPQSFKKMAVYERRPRIRIRAVGVDDIQIFRRIHNGDGISHDEIEHQPH